jgi:hypothetical protein
MYISDTRPEDNLHPFHQMFTERVSELDSLGPLVD